MKKSVPRVLTIYVLRVGIALDQFLNAVLGGYPNETLSGRAFRLGDLSNCRRWIVIKQIIDIIFFLQPEHCRRVFEKFYESRTPCGLYMPYVREKIAEAKYNRKLENEEWLNSSENPLEMK